MTEYEQGGQLELLPAKAPDVRRASLHLADLTGYEHATPDPELVELIGQLGLLQPVVVAGSPQTRYTVIEGRRRAKAIQQLAEDGRWPTPARVDALIMTAADGLGGAVQAGMTLALHASRSDSPQSELHAIEAILDQGAEEAHIIKQIAAQTGMPVQTVRRRLRLRNLTPPVRTAFDLGEITASVAEAAARLSAEEQAKLEQLLEDGERPTLAIVRELARARTATATVELPAGLFADQQTPWEVSVRGHIHAALEAIPGRERDGACSAALAGAIALLDCGANGREPPHAGANPSAGEAPDDATVVSEADTRCCQEDEERLLEELQRAVEFLHRQRCCDGAVAVKEAMRRLRPTRGEDE